jgi:hypothetical protein
VAKAFKVCGIMQNTPESCSNYLPCHFTKEKWSLPMKTLASDLQSTISNEFTVINEMSVGDE